MDFSFSSIAAGIIFGSFGIYGFKQGKKNSNVMQILIGITLIGYSYFVPDPWINWGLGTTLLIMLYRFRH